MQLYHGSPNKFDVFDYSRIRTNGTTEGVGFYFTDKLIIAEQYARGGYIYTANIHGKKALSDTEKTLTRDEVQIVLTTLNKRTQFLSNYGDVSYEGYGEVMRRALASEYDCNDTDTEIIGSIYNGDGYNPEVLDILYRELGYDHIKTIPEWGGKQELTIALTNDIIEIINVHELWHSHR